MLESRRFLANASPAKVLDFVVGEELACRPIKQSLIGRAVFPVHYEHDPGIVRANAKRLRCVLAEYYAREGRNDPVLILLHNPPGDGEPPFPRGMAYRPVFLYNKRTTPVSHDRVLPV
jgi:hypothetical protein